MAAENQPLATLQTLRVIVITGDERYTREIQRIVQRILTTKTAEAIGSLIRNNGFLEIRASDPTEANADTRPLGRHWAQARFYPNTGSDRADVSLKTAGGVTLKVRTIRGWPGWEPDEVLFHEMVHAGRFLSKQDGPDKEEEYFAVLVANIYISEKGKSFKDLRYHYELSSRSMTEAEVEPFVYLFQYDQAKKVNHYDLVAKFCRQHPSVAPMIGKAPAKFNPIRDYYAAQNTLRDIPIDIPIHEPVPVPIRIMQNEPYVLITDDYLISLLEPRYRADDIAGYGQRARKLEQVFGSLTLIEAAPLLVRLIMRKSSDRVPMLFHGHLHTATRAKLINILRTRLTK